MIRKLITSVLVWVIFSTMGWSQDTSKPIVRTELQTPEAVVGQPVILRITVLAPTFLPSPPIFPSMELPNLMVRLPERASGPASEKIGSDTWSGVTRAYRLYPMIPGPFRIDPQTVEVTYADPETNQPVRVSVATEAVTFSGTVPEGAEGLDPFIGADNLVLEQNIEGDPAAIKAGDAIIRTVTAKISGTSPMFLPDLIPALEAPGLAEYRKEPTLGETVDRGTISGTRTESVTYVAEGGGTFNLPPISLDWFDLDAKSTKTATVDGVEIVASGPPPATTAEARFDRSTLIRWGLAGLAVLAGIALIIIWIAPALWHWRQRRHAAWLASEAYAYKRAIAALRAHDLDGATRAIAQWSSRVSGSHDLSFAELDGALAALGANLFGSGHGSPPNKDWERAARALGNVRKNALKEASYQSGLTPLPPLNPRQPA